MPVIVCVGLTLKLPVNLPVLPTLTAPPQPVTLATVSVLVFGMDSTPVELVYVTQVLLLGSPTEPVTLMEHETPKTFPVAVAVTPVIVPQDTPVPEHPVMV
ncbi:MAG TPA: hypothetical protein VGL63_11705 [Streptosporangiaceae bacterium]